MREDAVKAGSVCAGHVSVCGGAGAECEVAGRAAELVVVVAAEEDGQGFVAVSSGCQVSAAKQTPIATACASDKRSRCTCMAVEIEDEEDDELFVRRGSLLTTRERELAESRSELLKMFAQMETVKQEAAKSRQEAAELREHIIITATKTAPISFRTKLAAFTAVLLLVAVAVLAYDGFVHPQSAEVAKRGSKDSVAPMPSPVQHHGAKSATAGDRQFTKAMQRLQDDLDALPGSESDIVKEINQGHPADSPVCPLEWTGGSAALVLGGKRGSGTPSMAVAINQCADAAEKLMDEKAAGVKKAEEAVNGSQAQ